MKALVPGALLRAVGFTRVTPDGGQSQRDAIKSYASSYGIEILRWENTRAHDSKARAGHGFFRMLLARMDASGGHLLLVERWERISCHSTMLAELLQEATRRAIIVTCADGRSTHASYKRQVEKAIFDALPAPEEKALKSISKDTPTGTKIGPAGQIVNDQELLKLCERVRYLRWTEKLSLPQIVPRLELEGFRMKSGRPWSLPRLRQIAAKFVPVHGPWQMPDSTFDLDTKVYNLLQHIRKLERENRSLELANAQMQALLMKRHETQKSQEARGIGGAEFLARVAECAASSLDGQESEASEQEEIHGNDA